MSYYPLSQKHYGEDLPRLLTLRSSADCCKIASGTTLIFRNLSVEVLAQIWAGTLVDDETKRKAEYSSDIA